METFSCVAWKRRDFSPTYVLRIGAKRESFSCQKAKRLWRVREKIWKELIDERVIKIENDKIVINFLDEQLQEREELSKKNSRNVAKRYQKPSIQPTVVESGSTANSDLVYNKEERIIRREDKREEESEIPSPLADEEFMYSIKKNYPKADYEKSWELCKNYHLNGPSPPTELWQWRQKFQTWLDIESKKITPQKEFVKIDQRERLKNL